LAHEPNTGANEPEEKERTHEEEQQVVVAPSVLTPESEKTEQQYENSQRYCDSMNPILDAIENFILKVGEQLRGSDTETSNVVG